MICLTSTSLIRRETEVKAIRQPTRPVLWLPSSDIAHARRVPRRRGAIHGLIGRTDYLHTQDDLNPSAQKTALTREL